MTPPISKGLCPWNCIMTSDVNCLLWGQSACYRKIPPEGQYFTALIFACCLPLLAFAHTVKWPTKWDALKHIFRCCNYALRRNWLESIITLSCCCFAWFDTEMPGSTAKSMVRQQKALPSMPESVFRWANTPPPLQNVVKSMKLVIR